MKNTNQSFSLNLSASSDPAAPWPLIIEHCKKMYLRANNNNRFYISSIYDGRIWNTVKLGYQGKAKCRDLRSKKYSIKLSTNFFEHFFLFGNPASTGEIIEVCKMQPLPLMNLHTKVISQFICSVMSDSETPWTTACHASLSITSSRSLPRLTSFELVKPSSHLTFCCLLLLLPSIFPSIRVFSNESALRIRWPKYWSFSFSISPSNEHSGLISFWMDWLDLPAVQATLKSLLQYHSSKASNFRCSAL